MRKLFTAHLGFCCGILLLAGCEGNGLVEVSGSVTVDGAPVDKGAITFYSVDGETGTGGGPIVDGKYNAKLPVGAMKVTISFPKVAGARKGFPDGPERSFSEESLPKKFSDRGETELRFEAKAGLNQKDWELKTK